MIYLSLGAGVQSSALYVMTTLGLHGCPKADVAIFADTQDEPAYVYAYLETLHAWGIENGGPRIDVVTKGRISDHSSGRSFIPAWTTGSDGRAAPLRRKCTSEFKLDPIEKHARLLLGLVPRQRAKGRVTATALIGFSLDEAARMKPSRKAWITNSYPLIDARLKRKDCLGIVSLAGLPPPLKSACVFCPYHDDAYWLWLKTDLPQEFEKAAGFDEHIRDMSKNGVRGKVFLHRTLQPLRTIDFAERRRLPLFESDQFQNECEGMCGV